MAPMRSDRTITKTMQWIIIEKNDLQIFNEYKTFGEEVIPYFVSKKEIVKRHIFLVCANHIWQVRGRKRMHNQMKERNDFIFLIKMDEIAQAVEHFFPFITNLH